MVSLLFIEQDPWPDPVCLLWAFLVKIVLKVGYFVLFFVFLLFVGLQLAYFLVEIITVINGVKSLSFELLEPTIKQNTLQSLASIIVNNSDWFPKYD